MRLFPVQRTGIFPSQSYGNYSFRNNNQCISDRSEFKSKELLQHANLDLVISQQTDAKLN
jgi:hypothetical protein